jgi:hypothetical protein
MNPLKPLSFFPMGRGAKQPLTIFYHITLPKDRREKGNSYDEKVKHALNRGLLRKDRLGGFRDGLLGVSGMRG